MNSSRVQCVRDSTALMKARKVSPNEHGLTAQGASVDWATHCGLVEGDAAIERVNAIRCGSCAAHAYPGATAQLTTIAAKLITWLFLFDDAYGEGRRAHDMRDLMETFLSFAPVFNESRPPDLDATPFHASMVDIVRECASLGDTSWMHRFTTSMWRYFGGCLLEFPHREIRATPSLADYRRLRAWSIGMHPVFDLIELSSGMLLPSAASEAPQLVQLRERTALLCAWVNDVYSYGKEKREGQRLNLVAVLAEHKGLSEQAAFMAAADVFNEDLEHFNREAAEAREVLEPSVHRYIDGLVSWVNGNYSWTGTSLRYGQPIPPP